MARKQVAERPDDKKTLTTGLFLLGRALIQRAKNWRDGLARALRWGQPIPGLQISTQTGLGTARRDGALIFPSDQWR